MAFEIKENGDWNLSKILYGADAVAQAIKGAVDLQKKSAFWDEENGIDYVNFRGITADDVDSIKLLKSRIIDQIKKVPYVQEVVIDESINIKDNILTIKVEVIININNTVTPKQFEFNINV